MNVRELRTGDERLGLLESLDSLRPASGLERGAARAILERAVADPSRIIFVAEEGGRIVGSITLLLEEKFIRGGSTAAHIEDVAVEKGAQGRGVGRMLVERALGEARGRGCYKTVLDCSEKLAGFYEKCGFERSGVCMRADHT